MVIRLDDRVVSSTRFRYMYMSFRQQDRNEGRLKHFSRSLLYLREKNFHLSDFSLKIRQDTVISSNNVSSQSRYHDVSRPNVGSGKTSSKYGPHQRLSTRFSYSNKVRPIVINCFLFQKMFFQVYFSYRVYCIQII